MNEKEALLPTKRIF